MSRSTTRSLALCLTTVFAVGCADGSTTGPGDPRADLVAGPACETINFEQFIHGGDVTQVSALGITWNVTVTTYPGPGPTPNPNNIAQAFDTDAGTPAEDLDLQTGGLCPACAPLNKILVIEDPLGFTNFGDSPWGGIITFTAATPGTFFIDMFTAIDDDSGEPSIDLRYDASGTVIAASSSLGNGSVQVVDVTSATTFTNSFNFEFGTAAADEITGSGGVDNIIVCVPETTGNEGCTLGYWKQEHHFDSWTTYTPSTTINSVFSLASFAGALTGDTFLEALNYKGGSEAVDAARLLLKQAVAALLNAASPDVDYALTTTQIINQVNAALASGSRTTMLNLANTLDGLNNAGCTLN